MPKLFSGFVIAGFLLFFSVSGFGQYRSRPVNMSKKRFKQIQSRRHVSRERTIYKPKRDASFFDAFRPKYNKVRYVNNNAINRKKNKKVVAKKRRQDDNYQYYRDYMESNKRGEKNNFSIYDK